MLLVFLCLALNSEYDIPVLMFSTFALLLCLDLVFSVDVHISCLLIFVAMSTRCCYGGLRRSWEMYVYNIAIMYSTSCNYK
jgi:hypothetical protein